MLLALDVGNSHVKLGLFDGGVLVDQWRLVTDPQRTSDEYGVFLAGLFARQRALDRMPRNAAIASVVPSLTQTMARSLRGYLCCSVTILSPHGKPAEVGHAHRVGIDRLANAAAAIHRSPGPLIVVDFGTATTFDAVSAEGEFLGGAIAPGLAISADALASRTALLPRVELRAPGAAIGRDTVTNMQSGLVYGYAALTDGLIARMRAELPGCRRVIATGGLAPVVAPEAVSIDEVVPALTLEGVSLLYEQEVARAR